MNSINVAIEGRLSFSESELGAGSASNGLEPILGLPDEISWKILSYLPVETLAECALVSRAWCRISRDEFLWERLLKTTFPSWRDLSGPGGKRESYIRNRLFHSNVKNGVYTTTVLQQQRRGDIFGLAVAEGILYLSFGDCTIQAWDLANRTHVAEFNGYNEVARNLAIAGGVLYSLSFNGMFKAWDLATKKPIRFSEEAFQGVRSLAGVGSLLYASDMQGMIKIWDAESKTWVREIPAHHVGVTRYLTASPNDFFYSGVDPSYKVRRYNLGTKESRDVFANRDKSIRSLAAASGILCVGFADGTIELQDVEKNQRANIFDEKRRQIRYIALHQGNLYSVGNDQAIIVRHFIAPDAAIFSELAAMFRSGSGQKVDEALDRFSRMPKKAREKIYAELYLIQALEEIFEEPELAEEEFGALPGESWKEVEDLEGMRRLISRKADSCDAEEKKEFLERMHAYGKECFHDASDLDPCENAEAIENYLELRFRDFT